MEHARVGVGETAQLRQDLQCFLVAAFGGEPARGEGEEDDAYAEDQAGNHLDEEGEPPGPFAGHVARAVGGPEGDYDAEYYAEFLEDEEGAADFWGGDFRDVEGGDGGEPVVGYQLDDALLCYNEIWLDIGRLTFRFPRLRSNARQ